LCNIIFVILMTVYWFSPLVARTVAEVGAKKAKWAGVVAWGWAMEAEVMAAGARVKGARVKGALEAGGLGD
jgi:hypothetical protein